MKSWSGETSEGLTRNLVTNICLNLCLCRDSVILTHERKVENTEAKILQCSQTNGNMEIAVRELESSVELPVKKAQPQ